MTQQMIKDGNPGRLIFRGVEGENDYPLLLAIIRSSRQADKTPMETTPEDIVQSYAPTAEFNPAREAIIAFLAGSHEAIGSSRLGWYSSNPDTRLYYQISYLMQAYRGQGLWQAIVRQNEQRLSEIAGKHPTAAQRFYQAWASDNQTDWISVLESSGYSAVRRFNNMLYQLNEIPQYSAPAGLTIRQAEPEHMHRIWEAQKEMNAGLFENVAEGLVGGQISGLARKPDEAQSILANSLGWRSTGRDHAGSF